MAQIWRLPLQVSRDFFLPIPKGSKILNVVSKGREPQVYFFVPDPEAEMEDRLFFVVPTGVDFRPEELEARYLGSFTVDQDRRSDGSIDPSTVLVFHVLVEEVPNA